MNDRLREKRQNSGVAGPIDRMQLCAYIAFRAFYSYIQVLVICTVFP
jgi:hypothetical protein